MKTVAFITPPDARFGFSLAGVAQHAVREEEAETTLTRLMAETEIALIILEETMARKIDEERLREMEARWRGMLLVLPSPARPAHETEDYAARLIRRIIGCHVRLNP